MDQENTIKRIKGQLTPICNSVILDKEIVCPMCINTLSFLSKFLLHIQKTKENIMELAHMITILNEKVFIWPFTLIFISNIIISIKTRFIQVRMLPTMLRLFWGSKTEDQKNENPNTLPSRDAVLTVISTSVGIGNLVGPIVAIKMGGPGALIIFLISVFFGAATIFSEVKFAITFRKKLPDGSWAGGAMQYLKKAIAPWAATVYALCGSLLLLAWSSAQSNQFAEICQTYGIPSAATGGAVAILVLLYLLAGIRKIGDLSAKIVPLMFAIITILSFYIIFSNITILPSILWSALKSAFTPKAFGGAGIGLMVRWAVAKGTQASEAAAGTTTIPHSMVEHAEPYKQGILAMLSAYAVLCICAMVGLVVLVTGAWQDPTAGMGIKVLAHSFAQYIPSILSNVILLVSIFLFAFGTVIGNAYNGGQCFSYVTKNRWLTAYYVGVALTLVFGAIFSVEFIWSFVDLFVIPVALINLTGLLILIFKRNNK